MAAKRPTAAEKAQTLLRAVIDRLQYLRETGRESPTIEQLATDLGQSTSVLLKLVTRKTEPAQFVAAAKHVSSPVTLADNLEGLVGSTTLLDFVVSRARDKRLSGNRPLRSDAKKLVADAGVDKRLAPSVVARIVALEANGQASSALAELLWPTPREVTERLLAVLRESVQAVAEVAPVGTHDLLTRTGFDSRWDPVKRALKSREFLEAVVVCVAKPAKEPAYTLVENCERAAPALLRHGMELLAATRLTTLFSASMIAGAQVKAKDARVRVEREIERLADRRELPESVGWLREKGKRRFFRRVDVEWGVGATRPLTTMESPSASPSVSSPVSSLDESQFEQAFDAAFARIDALTGGKNFVKVGELRRELEEYSREAFDAGLRALRVTDRYAMESAHGGAVRLTDEELRAGIREGSSLLIYVSRK